MYFVAVLYGHVSRTTPQMVPSRPELPDYYTATQQLAERRGQPLTSRPSDHVIRRSRSCDSVATPPVRRWTSVQQDDSDLSEDGIVQQTVYKFMQFL